MVAGTQQQPQQLQLQTQPPQQQQQPISAEEEALKRNTDCVYFLASPLTCKKGSECEYRHSEYARINPRDCWYWLNGNCLNPKCSFRHPPLDGLLGTQATPSAPSVGSGPPSSQTATASVAAGTQNSSKQPVPCIFFQKGCCMKGDKCAFLHGPNSTPSMKVPQPSAPTFGSEPSIVKKAFDGLQKCTQEQRIPQANSSKLVGVPPKANHTLKVETAPSRNGVSFERITPSVKAFDDESLRCKTVNTPVINGNLTSRSSRSHIVNVSDDNSFQNGKDADEFLRESSPGFDVLVDDELRDPEYFHGEDQYRRGHDGRNLNSMDEYDMEKPADYGTAADIDRERFRDSHGYDSYDHMQGQYAWDHHRVSSERLLVGPAHFDRRGYRKSHSPDNIIESDLRHRLSKHRRVDGLRSVINHDHAVNNHVDDRNYRGSSRRDSHQKSQHEGPLGSRFRGRIKLPGGSSSVNSGDLSLDREFDRSRSRGRLSPSRPQISTNQGRFRDRLKGKAQDDYSNQDSNFRGLRQRRDDMDDDSIGFSGPKRLSELKVGRVTETKEQSHLGKRKNTRMEVSQHSEDLSFEGPKPLSEILKRKRGGAESAAFGSGNSVTEEDNQRENREINQGDFKGNRCTVSKQGNSALSNEGESKSATAEVVGIEHKAEGSNVLSSEAPNVNDEVEDGMIYDETIDDQEFEVEDQAHGEYDYEQGEEGEYDGENVEGEEIYYEEEEGEGDDDFAKKIGVVFS
ncbi:zinc finger CCCH domain-containing protein 17 [Humulus lupulus]|uniref:zinc finger CCCH domain-containing protein 17 n=1 Tax=Humulus lupulus TaxID=3486 RepID=UPI002B40E59B|nr:zinc finger CCCH domain-containing protein 17 [Humulus lupulus]XP_062106294.1 zinc finger CCCH domain-containing protein 17 [Humulus lupulus]XP_062106295.1 zinc finger CCCH domain-containing protein 17 [Humulus lupulus]